jgi:hypothetical protein
MVSVVAASPAAASVLSASSQAVGTKASREDYLQVTEVQKELNATMQEINDAAVANGPLSVPAPSTGEGGFLSAEREGSSGWVNRESIANPVDDGLIEGRLSGPVLSARGTRPTPGTFVSDRHSFRYRRGGGHRPGGGGGHGGGAHAAPEPSTWMLFGTGLALLGGYVLIRRRAVIES